MTAMAALANARRLEILSLLRRGEHAVGALQRAVRMEQSAVSQHLARLRTAGLVAARRDGQTIYYRLDKAKLAAVMAGLGGLLRG